MMQQLQGNRSETDRLNEQLEETLRAAHQAFQTAQGAERRAQAAEDLLLSQAAVSQFGILHHMWGVCT